MVPQSLTSITIITSPYHVGLRYSPTDRYKIGEGPDCIKSAGLVPALKSLGLQVLEIDVPPVDDFEGEIGRSFELFRRISTLVTAARNAGSFPVVLAGNCNSTIGVAAGLYGSAELKASEQGNELGCVWFDAHDDYNTPDTVIGGYFDSMGIAMMTGECWKLLMNTVPGFQPMSTRQIVHCGMRDVTDVERQRVEESGMGIVWGNSEKKVDFAAELRRLLDERYQRDSPMIVHLDVDSFDVSIGKANKYACPGGLFEDDLVQCMQAIAERTLPMAFTVASFDPGQDGDEPVQRIASLAIVGIKTVVEVLIAKGVLVKVPS